MKRIWSKGMQTQTHNIPHYSFSLVAFKAQTLGWVWSFKWRPYHRGSFSGGTGWEVAMGSWPWACCPWDFGAASESRMIMEFPTNWPNSGQFREYTGIFYLTLALETEDPTIDLDSDPGRRHSDWYAPTFAQKAVCESAVFSAVCSRVIVVHPICSSESKYGLCSETFWIQILALPIVSLVTPDK